MKITVVGSGYVGMANAVMFAKKNDVTILDIDKLRVASINLGVSTIEDKDISDELAEGKLSLKATMDKKKAYSDADWVVIATPTDYDEATNYFNTDTVEGCIRDAVEYNADWDKSSTTIVVKSTIPVGFIDDMQEKYTKSVIFSPEFLREGTALRDCLRPERIVVGDIGYNGESFAKLINECIIPNFPSPPVNLCGTKEAESIKLFANTYLAMRVSFFNELDMYAEANNMNAYSIIEGVTGDSRIGRGYSNPSFGYGGYCFPKDTKQLLANFRKHHIPTKIIQGIVYANENRKDWISRMIQQKDNVSVVGIYRLAMKSGSDNYRCSAIQGVVDRLTKAGVKVIIHEPMIEDDKFLGCVIENDIDKFNELSDLIVTNRMSDDIIESKVYTRDIYNNN